MLSPTAYNDDDVCREKQVFNGINNATYKGEPWSFIESAVLN